MVHNQFVSDYCLKIAIPPSPLPHIHFTWFISYFIYLHRFVTLRIMWVGISFFCFLCTICVFSQCYSVQNTYYVLLHHELHTVQICVCILSFRFVRDMCMLMISCRVYFDSNRKLRIHTLVYCLLLSVCNRMTQSVSNMNESFFSTRYDLHWRIQVSF